MQVSDCTEIDENMSNTTHGLNHTHDTEVRQSYDLPGLISVSTRRLITDVISCGIEPFPSLLGIVGNGLSLMVLCHQGIKHTTNIILIGLATADLLYVLSSSYRLFECLTRRLDTKLAAEIEIHSMLHINKSATIFSVVSRWYTCFMAVERFIVVRYPLKAPAVLRPERLIVASVLLWVLAFVSSFYFYALFVVKEVHNPVHNTTERRVQFSDFLVHNFHILAVVDGLVMPVFTRYLPLLIVFVCTCVILRSLRTSLHQRRQMTSSNTDAQQQQITKTLVAICIVFLVTSIPGIVISVARFLFVAEGFGDVGRYRSIHAVSVSITLFFTLINSSVNVVFYVMFNRKFTSTCKQLFAICWKPYALCLRDKATHPNKKGSKVVQTNSKPPQWADNLDG